MEIKLLKSLFSEGSLISVKIIEQKNLKTEKYTWDMLFLTSQGNTISITLAGRGGVKEYKSLSAAVEDAKNIGFKEVNIVINHD